jgi:hypothetical protein
LVLLFSGWRLRGCQSTKVCGGRFVSGSNRKSLQVNIYQFIKAKSPFKSGNRHDLLTLFVEAVEENNIIQFMLISGLYTEYDFNFEAAFRSVNKHNLLTLFVDTVETA